MSDSAQDFWDILTEAEALSAQAIMRELAPEAWTRPLLAAIDDNGGLIRANKSLLFELRFAATVRNAGLALQLPFPKISESMGNHDSKIVDADSVD